MRLGLHLIAVGLLSLVLIVLVAVFERDGWDGMGSGGTSLDSKCAVVGIFTALALVLCALLVLAAVAMTLDRGEHVGNLFREAASAGRVGVDVKVV